MSTPSVYVLVINWNGEEHLHECFETLLRSTCQNLRVLLIDNASTDGSVAFVREEFGSDSRVEILELKENMGWSRGNNAGLEYAIKREADYILLLNNDTATDSKAIECLVAAAEADADIGALSPKILLYDAPHLLNSIGLTATNIGTAWDIGLGEEDGEQWNEEREIVGVCGAAMFLRADALRKAGLLPTDFDIYLDDLDLCLRIWDAGYAIRTCPGAVFRHKFSATMGEGKRARRKYYLNTRNRLRLIERNFPLSMWPGVEIAYDIAECRAIGRAVLNGEFWKVWAHARSWVSGLLYLPKALAARNASGLRRGRFRKFLISRPQFFPGVELPKK